MCAYLYMNEYIFEYVLRTRIYTYYYYFIFSAYLFVIIINPPPC